MTRLTKHFTLEELTFSQTAARHGIDNTPPGGLIIANLTRVAAVMEQVRELLGHPIVVSSGYRCPELNRIVGGSSNSAHKRGLAVDFTCPGFGSPKQVAEAIQASAIEYDQLIFEYGQWVHLSLTEGVARRQELSAVFGKGLVSGIVSV